MSYYVEYNSVCDQTLGSLIELSEQEIEAVSGGEFGWNEFGMGLAFVGAGATAIGVFIPSPVSPGLIGLGVGLAFVGSGISFVAAVHGGDPPTGKNAHVKPV